MTDRVRKAAIARTLGSCATLGLLAVLAGASCQAPTQVQLVLRSEIPCGPPEREGYGLHELYVYAGNEADVRTRISKGAPPDAKIEGCTSASGELGTLTLYPEANDRAYVRVVASLVQRGPDGGTTLRKASTCPLEARTQLEADRCLVALRSFAYTRHATGFLPVRLQESCIPQWWKCTSTQTCVDGDCIETDKIDPTPTLEPFDGSVPKKDAGADVAIADAEPLDDYPVDITAGPAHTCALYLKGGVRCWGDNASGALGSGDLVSHGIVPGSMATIGWTLGSGASAIAASTTLKLENARTCALVGKSVQCWGSNTGATILGLALGNNIASPVPTPKTIDTALAAAGVTIGSEHACAWDATNGKCWGYNTRGQLGSSQTAATAFGQALGSMGAGLPGFLSPIGQFGTTLVSVGAGLEHTCALFKSASGKGDVKCWGLNSGAEGRGILGLGNESPAFAPSGPVALGPNASIGWLAVGGYHACALQTPSRILKCWGNNTYGQLGQNDPPGRFRGGSLVDTGNYGPMGDQLPTIAFSSQAEVQSVAAGVYHNCVILADGSLRCWGRNESGQLGAGDTDERGSEAHPMSTVIPVNLGPGRTALRVAAGLSHTCALLDNHKIKCWGSNSHGQLGLEVGSATIGAKPGEMDTLDYVKLPP